MRCLPWTNLASDRPYWVSRAVFFKFFDQSDFAARVCSEVEPRYRSDWFPPTNSEPLHFELPTVQFVGGKTQFISGRHRTAVLIQYLNDLPLALFCPLDQRPYFPPEVMQRQMLFTDVFEIPDLPIITIPKKI